MTLNLGHYFFISWILLVSNLGFSQSRPAIKRPIAIVEESVFVNDPSLIKLKDLQAIPELTVDHVGPRGYELYGPKGMMAWLKRNGISFVAETSRKSLSGYPTPEEIETELHNIHKAYPAITELTRIGTSVKGRGLWVMKISKNPTVDEIEPEFKYISSMHGNEITGRELMVRLIADLVRAYGKDPRITDLIDSTEIYIMPSMNPDGAAAARRGNGNNVDLNRDFPDFSTSDNQNTPAGRQVETQAIMQFQDRRHFSLSANFHGGAEVMNYAWDTLKDPHPDVDFVKSLAIRYANLVPYMKSSKTFPGGITNGFDWYEVNNGMQDWSIYWYNDLQYTVELSNSKWPDYSQIDGFYRANRDALVDLIAQVHGGAGIVLETPKLSGQVEVTRVSNGASVKLGRFLFSDSEFYSVLAPGDYIFSVAAKNGFKRDYRIRHNPASFGKQRLTSRSRYYRVK